MKTQISPFPTLSFTFLSALFLFLPLSPTFSVGDAPNEERASSSSLPRGYGGVTLGMDLETTKSALRKNSDFGYHGDRDVSMLPGEGRTLIETDARKGSVYSFLTNCYFQFNEDNLFIITINLDTERLDYYTVFARLMKKYGEPLSLSPKKALWTDGTTEMTLEKPLSLKYVDKSTFDSLTNKSLVNPTGSEKTREMFLDSL